MKSTRATLSAVALAGTLLAGCASIHSNQVKFNPDVPARGVVYYLPTQGLLLTLTVVENKKKVGKVTTSTFVRTIDLQPTPVVPDLDERYALAFRRNHLGVSKAIIKVDTNGLLSGESSGSTTSQVKEILEGLATSAGALAPYDLVGENHCAAAGTYRWVVDAQGNLLNQPTDPVTGHLLELSDCRLAFMVKPFASQTMTSVHPTSGKHGYGVFYRQSLPMLAVVSDTAENRALAFTPSIVSKLSPTNFLPIPRTVFSNVTWKLTFSNGMPTVYDIDAGSDVLGLVTLPAEVIAAYSKALTAGFTSRKGNLDAEAGYLQAVADIAVQRANMAVCQSAIDTGDLDKIKATCGKK